MKKERHKIRAAYFGDVFLGHYGVGYTVPGDHSKRDPLPLAEKSELAAAAPKGAKLKTEAVPWVDAETFAAFKAGRLKATGAALKALHLYAVNSGDYLFCPPSLWDGLSDLL